MRLFLSHPPEDVKGFIAHRANDFKCAGLWKVYGNEEKARSLLAKYKNARRSTAHSGKAARSWSSLPLQFDHITSQKDLLRKVKKKFQGNAVRKKAAPNQAALHLKMKRRPANALWRRSGGVFQRLQIGLHGGVVDP